MSEYNLSITEENYIKSIYQLSGDDRAIVNTNAIAEMLNFKAASVTEMLKRLDQKELIHYIPYRGVKLNSKGEMLAKGVVRRHRLWETFLYNYLGFGWDEIHDLAEELEHVRSSKLVDRLDRFMEYPATDPHGAPIPNAHGEVVRLPQFSLLDAPIGTRLVIRSVEDESDLLRYLSSKQINIGEQCTILTRYHHDNSIRLHLHALDSPVDLSAKTAELIYVSENQ